MNFKPKLKRHADTEEAKEVDRLVTYTLAGLVGEIFIVDILFAKYRAKKRNGEPRVTKLRTSPNLPTTFSDNGRRVWAIKAFFIYLAVHMTVKLKYDPLVYITERWFSGE